jgi:hypothetical protein
MGALVAENLASIRLHLGRPVGNRDIEGRASA